MHTVTQKVQCIYTQAYNTIYNRTNQIKSNQIGFISGNMAHKKL